MTEYISNNWKQLLTLIGLIMLLGVAYARTQDVPVLKSDVTALKVKDATMEAKLDIIHDEQKVMSGDIKEILKRLPK